jgi:hypothetical protein
VVRRAFTERFFQLVDDAVGELLRGREDLDLVGQAFDRNQPSLRLCVLRALGDVRDAPPDATVVTASGF